MGFELSPWICLLSPSTYGDLLFALSRTFSDRDKEE